MNKQVIEYAGVPVGIAIPEEGAVRFVAVKFHVFDLDQRRFSTLGQLQGAVHSHMSSTERLAA
ncbi:hypothetical protein GGQ64_004755 [Rhizobium azooxidifex]|uniref:Uncharacterized protein n=1 Tax=Mycoplana azooxidifex TaxID=1636188 RepID=A0A7W6DGS3_9HYPH|nr:hypothetical protein [Mycoplana azooxidifex]MBB3979513.1 hypothetical protein [Mycoplana azooxidifex]